MTEELVTQIKWLTSRLEYMIKSYEEKSEIWPSVLQSMKDEIIHSKRIIEKINKGE